MGFSYRKSFKAGPIRVTASKSGVSYSAGVKGARITRKANGKVQTTLSAPGTGLRYTTTSGRKGAAPAQARVVTAPQGRGFAGPATPVVFKGMRSSITLHPDRIEIQRKRLTRALSGHTVIAWHDVVDVEVVKPSLLGGSGYVHVVSRSRPVLLAPPGRRNFPAAMANSSTVVFSNLPGGFRTHKALVAALMACARQQG